jgi:diaminopimelate decarboxylase
MQSQPSARYYDWWQRQDLCYQDGKLMFAGHPVSALAARYGSPAFVYSMARVKANLQRLHSALEAAGFAGRYSILYAMKANRFAPLLTHLKTLGLCGIDACSPQEVELAVSCGFKPAQISFTAGSLSKNDFDILSRFDGLVMDCDSIHAIKTWGKYRPGTAIGIRINPALGVSRENNSALQYAGSVTTKFGIYREQFQEALAIAKAAGLTVYKIHFHTGCGYLTPQLEQWDRVIESCQWFLDQCPDLRVANVGGGLGVPHTAEDGTLDLTQWGEILRKHFGNRKIQLEVEPGEYVLKDAGLLLLGKTYLEKKQNTWFLGLDAGFNIAPEPAYYKLPFQPLPLELGNGTFSQLQVVGNINEALDVWFQDAWLPAMENQDYLALINAGAYSSSMASNHCMRGAFREYLID